MPTILITGGTGLIGTALSGLLSEKGYRVILLSRRAPETFHWDPDAGTIDTEAVRLADYIIHLAGAGIADKRWTAKRKRIIEESRTRSGVLLVKALREIPNNVRAVISASGIGWYGADATIPDPRPFKETDPPDGAFLGETCRRWEEAVAPVSAMGIRLVIFRIGPVLTPKGGALPAFLRPVKMGLAAILGSGRQVLSWIHIDDVCRLFVHAVEHTGWSGIYNAAAPRPVDNRTLMTNLARRLKGRYFVTVYIPSFLLKIAVGGLSIEVLKSTTVSAERTREEGFQFLYPSIDSALDQLLPHR